MTGTTTRRPFPIAELVIALLVTGVVIAAMQHPSVRNLSTRELEVKQNLNNIQLGVERYCVDTGRYPRFLTGGTGGSAGNPWTALDPLLAWGCLDAYPRNPFQCSGATSGPTRSRHRRPERRRLW